MRVAKWGNSLAIRLPASVAIRTLCRAILPIDIETHTEALRLADRYGPHDL